MRVRMQGSKVVTPKDLEIAWRQQQAKLWMFDESWLHVSVEKGEAFATL